LLKLIPRAGHMGLRRPLCPWRSIVPWYLGTRQTPRP
jgi:hypothetical protein